MIVMIDGKKHKCKSEVRIIYPTVVNSGWTGDEDVDAELHLTASNEGVVTDLYVEGTVTGSGWKMVADIVEECH